eukprot:6178080-Pleurochrysis_carterae.AAC.1
MPSDGLSLHDAHPDGYGYDSAPQSLISLITPEYESPAFDYSNDLSMSYSVSYGKVSALRTSVSPTLYYALAPTVERVGRIFWSAGIRLPPPEACLCVRSCFIALGAREIRKDFVIFPIIRFLLADEFIPSMASAECKANMTMYFSLGPSLMTCYQSLYTLPLVPDWPETSLNVLFINKTK